MEGTQKVILFWSGGKKSALSYHLLKSNPDYQVLSSFSLIDKETNSIRHHGVPETILSKQAELSKMPLHRLYISKEWDELAILDYLGPTILKYKKLGVTALAIAGEEGIPHILGAKNLRSLANALGLSLLNPLKNMDSKDLVKMFSKNHKAIVTSIDYNLLDGAHLNKEFNQAYTETLPKEVDPFSMKGEFHTFVTFSPYFPIRVPFSKAIVKREGPFELTLLRDP